MRRALAAALLRGAASPLTVAEGGLGAASRTAACGQSWAGSWPLRCFASDGESPAGDDGPAGDAGADRRLSGSQASTSAAPPEARPGAKPSQITSIAHLRPARPSEPPPGKAQPGSSLGRPPTTLEAKKAYRQQQQHASRGRRAQAQAQAQQRTAAEQAAASPTLAAKQAARRAQRAREEAEEAAPWSGLLAEKRTTDALTEADCGKYVAVDLDALPECFSQNHPDGQELHPRGGCQGLFEELLANGEGLIMHRQCTQQLTQAVLSGERRRLYLTGPPFSGKSIALAATVSQLRTAGWLVLYVPQALQLTHGGFFSRRSPADAQWDTPECARLLLHYLLEAHPRRCEQVRSASSGASLAALCSEGMAAEEPAAVVGAFLEALEAVLALPDAAVCIDGYQALYCPSAYGEWLSQHRRRVLQPGELRVAAAMRLLERPDAACTVIAAASRGGSYSPKLKMPMPADALFNIPRLSQAEWRAMAQFYKLTGVTDALPAAKVAKAFLLTQGNAREYRRTAGGLLDLEGLEEAAA